MKEIVIILILGMIFLVVPLASAEISIDVDVQDSFSLEETMQFEYSLLSDINTQIKFIPHILCPNAPIAMLQEQTIQLQANTPYTATYTDQIVQDWFEPQTCTAYVQILEPYQQIVSKEFQIITDPSFDFDIKLPKKVFILGETIKLDYSSSVVEPSISATLIYPNGKTKSIDLPTTIKASEIGTYELQVSAIKENYKTIDVKEQFAVIKQEANIGYVVLDEDERFEEDEQKETDKKSNIKDLLNNIKDKKQLAFWIFISSLILLGVVILFFIIRGVVYFQVQ